MKRIHLIAIGGSAMHNLALALHEKSYEISGSDDEIVEPSKSRLDRAGLLPAAIGWDAARITGELDAVILGMHARADNPELAKAKELNIPVFSYPEYLYEQSKHKTRVVIGGSHGKTTITSMILHVLKTLDRPFDFMVGAQISGFETMVRLSEEAPVIILEGDEYLSSPIDRRPKFHLYHPHIALLSGIAWDHINVFPTYENYVDQFRQFIKLIHRGGTLIWCEEDKELQKLTKEFEKGLDKRSYGIPSHRIENGVTILETAGGDVPLLIFGNHNLMNLEGARIVCELLDVSKEEFYKAIMNFTGAAKRLELVAQNDDAAFYKDFAHSPSKLKATINAMKSQHPSRKLVACMELHTFSSLNEDFLKEYAHCMDEADEALVYFNPHTIEHKKLKPISTQQVKDAFARKDLQVFTSSKEITDYLRSKTWRNSNLLMMSSGNFDGVDFAAFGKELF
jgi:UDP-N-acetylmuramate: L-alanyl-gamma-D-glutamyl-meso-diaminopimelate ligase